MQQQVTNTLPNRSKEALEFSFFTLNTFAWQVNDKLITAIAGRVFQLMFAQETASSSWRAESYIMYLMMDVCSHILANLR